MRRKKNRIRPTGYRESKADKGRTKLVDNASVVTLISFPYKDGLYHIITDQDRTYLAGVKDMKFEIITTISETSLWPDREDVILTADDQYVVFFRNRIDKGYINVIGNKITIYKYTH